MESMAQNKNLGYYHENLGFRFLWKSPAIWCWHFPGGNNWLRLTGDLIPPKCYSLITLYCSWHWFPRASCYLSPFSWSTSNTYITSISSSNGEGSHQEEKVSLPGIMRIGGGVALSGIDQYLLHWSGGEASSNSAWPCLVSRGPQQGWTQKDRLPRTAELPHQNGAHRLAQWWMAG